MLRPASARTVRAGLGLALIGALGNIWIAGIFRTGMPDWMAPLYTALTLVAIGSGIAGAVIAAYIAIGEARLSRLFGVVASTIGAIGYYNGLSFIFTNANWGGADDLLWCEGPCPPTEREIMVALFHAAIAIVLIATAIVAAALTKNAAPRERIRIALLVIVASIPVANLLVFTATSPHNKPPSAATAPVG